MCRFAQKVVQLEGLITRCGAAGLIQAQQGHMRQRHPQHRRTAQLTQQRVMQQQVNGVGYDNPTLFFASTCSAR